MMDNMIDRIVEGAKTSEGKIIAILLALSLAFMAWNAMSINAFARDSRVADAVKNSLSEASSESSSDAGSEVVDTNPTVVVTPSEQAEVAENVEQADAVADAVAEGDYASVINQDAAEPAQDPMAGVEPAQGPMLGAEPVTTEITFMGNGGTSGGEGIVFLGDLESPASITLTDQGFVRDGYTLVGWAMGPDQDVRFELGETIVLDAVGKGAPGFNTLYAVWKSNEEIATQATDSASANTASSSQS